MGGDDALALAVAALRRRERSRAELDDWLRQRGVGAAEAEQALVRLAELGELDDERFARRYAADKRELRGWGPSRIRESLASRGIAESDIEAALAEDDADGQLSRACALLTRRGQPLESDSDRRRALDYLTRRGYDYELAYEAVRRCAGVD